MLEHLFYTTQRGSIFQNWSSSFSPLPLLPPPTGTVVDGLQATSMYNLIISYSRLHSLELPGLSWPSVFGEEVFALLDVGLDGVTSWFPPGGAH